MAHQTVTATAFARKFSDYLNQVRYQGVSFDVKRGSEIIACVTPPSFPKGFPIADLDHLLRGLPEFSADEAVQFARDIHQGEQTLIAPVDAWSA